MCQLRHKRAITLLFDSYYYIFSYYYFIFNNWPMPPYDDGIKSLNASFWPRTWANKSHAIRFKVMALLWERKKIRAFISPRTRDCSKTKQVFENWFRTKRWHGTMSHWSPFFLSFLSLQQIQVKFLAQHVETEASDCERLKPQQEVRIK